MRILVTVSDPLLVHRPTLPALHDVDALVAESRPAMSDLAIAQTLGRLILCLALAIEARPQETRQTAGTHRGHLKPLFDPARQHATLSGLQSVFRMTSQKMCLSRVRSATQETAA